MDTNRLRSLSDAEDEDEHEHEHEHENKRRRNIFVYQGGYSEGLAGSEALTHILIDSYATVICKSVFRNCQRLVEVDFRDGAELKSIRERAFESCTALEKVSVPSTVTEVGKRAFACCLSLHQVEFPKFGLFCIGEEAFLECSSLEFFPVPSTVAFIKARAFQKCTDLVKVDFEEERDGMNKTLLSLSCIGEEAFDECHSLREFCLSSNVMSLGKAAFRCCESLQNADLSKTKLSVIDEITFLACRTLELVRMPSTLEKILFGAFDQCEILGMVTLNEGLKVIGDGAFAGCEALTKVSTPATLEVVGKDAFSGCYALTDVPLSEKVMSIGEAAFWSCRKLTTKMSIPSAVPSIDKETFWNCSLLAELKLAIGLQRIEDDALQCCTSLIAVSLPVTMQRIGSCSFAGCISLLVVEMSKRCSESMEWGESAFWGCDSLVNISVSSAEGTGTIGSIPNSTFNRCWNLLPARHTHFESDPEHPLYEDADGCFDDGHREKDQLFDNLAQSLQNRYSNLPVHEACYHDSDTKVDELVQKIRDTRASAEKEELFDRFGFTPFHVFATSANLRADVLEVLLNYYPIQLLWRKDRQNNTMMDYLLLDQRCVKSIPRIKVVLKPIMAYLSSLGLENKWKLKACREIVSEDDWEGGYCDRYQAMSELRKVVNFCTRIEGSSILELALWKRMSECRSTEDNQKSTARVKCGANMVIPNVMAYVSNEEPVERDPFREVDPW
mmetsp:Transcript_4159/g.9750  ORF Transcript_4159/g.9750 Transcript_4159/m.9750 type:complete len:728 (-) Transcript_4159:122-2305(-)